ncbi:MAG TPA: hypothetical protein H9877_05070 [Candidatus Gordonibacter avicola]|nr:hypothetical protein [Candidatus Gordonibacter avicola]
MKLLKQGQANEALEKGKPCANAAPDKPRKRAHGRRGARARMGAALSVVLAGTLVSGVCGGSLTSAVALAAEGSGGAGAASAPAATAPADAKNATPKEEVVYARLSAAGAVDDVYVVNILKPDAPGTVTDFGDYQAVENLTDASGISQNGDAITANVAGDSLSYQGDLGAHALPWKVSIVYKLDGTPVEAAELGGATGALSVEITTKQDAMVDPAFFDNYLLQITVPFAAGKATDVATEDGQIALAGSDTQVTFTGMPGKDGSFTATAQVKDFEMSGITFAAVPFSMSIEAPDTEGLVSGFRQLGDGVGELKSGADGVASGAGNLASGAGQVAEGIGGLASGAGQLVGGANGLTEGAGQLAAGARDAASGAQGVADGAAGLAGGLEAYRGGLLAQAAEARSQMADTSALEQAYQGAVQTYVAGYAQAFAAAKAQGLDDTQAYQTAASATADLAASMQSALTAFMTATGGNAGAQGASDALDGAAAGLGAADDPASLAGGAAALAAGSAALVTGLSSLSEGAGGIAAGAGSLASGASQLASGANQASVGAGELSGGASQLASGAQQLADGTGALYTEVQAIPDKVQQEIDAMMADYDKSDFKPISFASPKNTNVTLVQFVMSTDPIKAPIAEEPQSPEPEQSFWDRLLALFGL